MSNRYNNPQELYGKPVLRIEEVENDFDCMVVAVSRDFVWEVEEELQKYQINKIVVINPLMDDDFPSGCILSDKSKISPKSFLAEGIQVISDDTSVIIIDDNVAIKKGTIIMATGGSCIHIGAGTDIGENAFISVEGESNIDIKEKVNIGALTRLKVESNSEICIGEKSCVANECDLIAGYSSNILFKGENALGKHGYVNVTNGLICVGRKTTFNGFLFMACDGTSIHIGEDNMFSFYVKVNTGNHKIIDRITGSEITNCKSIQTGDHVWIGMGATLLPGCDVGNGSVVGAASVVNGMIPENSTCAGNIAKVLRNSIEWER